MEQNPAPVRKAGLETPLRTVFYGERAVGFAPPLAYDALVFGCLVGGPILALYVAASGSPIGFMHPLIATVALLAVGFAGLWALFSNERMVCDLKTRTYARLEGQAKWKKLRRGNLDELDALVLMAEKIALPTLTGGQAVVYRLVLHWKNASSPLLVVERKTVHLPGSSPLNGGADPWIQKGLRISKALGVPFYDNSYYHSPCPVPTV